MSQQQPGPARPRPRRATTQSKTSPSNGSQPPEKAPAQPAPDDRAGWKSYWEEHQQPWRTEREIDAQRQQELAKCRAIIPDVEKGIYPFGGMKLSRADIEWLLATHENGRGPIDWSDKQQRIRKGLDLRGVQIAEQTVLSFLPLAKTCGGFAASGWPEITPEWLELAFKQTLGLTEGPTEEQREQARLDASRTNLANSKLEGAILQRVSLERANLQRVSLERADLSDANLDGAFLIIASLKEANLSGASLKKANLGNANLDGANLQEVSLERANLSGASLKKANLRNANLDGANLQGVSLEEADLSDANLRGANLKGINLEKADLTNANLDKANLQEASLKGANLSGASLERADLYDAKLGRTNFSGATLERTYLLSANLEEAYLPSANLRGADLRGAKLDGADFSHATLEGANLDGASLKEANLTEVTLADSNGIGLQLADIRWDGVNLAVVDWSPVQILGNEYIAQQKKDRNGKAKDKEERLNEYRRAVRANRQLAVVLQAQGLNEEATRFAYRANVLQRKLLWFQMIQHNVSFQQRIRKLGTWVFSHLLNLVAGYGYRPERSFLAYLLVIFGFMGLYLLTSHFIMPHLRWDEALVLSVSSFHGRGFFPQTITLGDAYARLAVTEAVLGLFIEISFIATFTQRFFGK